MAVTVVINPDSTGYKKKAKSRFLGVNDDNELVNGSLLLKYVDATTEEDLPPGGNVAEQKIKSEVEVPLSGVINRYIDPPALVYVDPAVVGTAKRIGEWVMKRDQSQLTSVPVNPHSKDMLYGVFRKLVEIMVANGEL